MLLADEVQRRIALAIRHVHVGGPTADEILDGWGVVRRGRPVHRRATYAIERLHESGVRAEQRPKRGWPAISRRKGCRRLAVRVAKP